MIRLFVISVLVLSFSTAFGASTKSVVKDADKIQWKTLISKRGYEITYPASWKFELGFDAEPEETIDNAEVIETQTKITSQLNGDQITFNGPVITAHKFKSAKEAEDEKNKAVRNSRNSYKIVFARSETIDSATAVYNVQILDDKKLRWRKRLYCGNNFFDATTSSKEPLSDSTIQKVKTGELFLSLPMDNVFKSLRCR